MSNTAILLILRDHMIDHRIEKGIVEVQCKDCAHTDASMKESGTWIKVPDICSALWVAGKLA
jgi:hypothetical protein